MLRTLIELTASPTRLALFRALADQGPASLSELARAVGVHSNTLRPLLAELEQEGAVVREHRPGPGRGRPTVRYLLAEDWPGSETVPSELAALLAGLIQRLDPDAGEVAVFGRQWGLFLAGRPGSRTGQRGLPRALERLGFEVEQGRELRLRSCPCPLVSPGRPELVCQLARAVADGVLDGSGASARVTRARHDPVQRSCVLEIGE